MQKIKLTLIILILSIINVVYAQDFEVSPAQMEFKIDPGETQTRILSIKNHSNFKTPFTITFADFIVDKDGKKQIINQNSSKNSCAAWITPEKVFFDIDPNEQVEVTITMQAPEGDYSTRWAMLYVQTAKVKTSYDADKGLGAGVRLSGRIAVQIYRTSQEELTPDISIKDLREISEPNEEGRKFTAQIENNGASISKCKVMFIASDIKSGEEFDFDPIFLDSFPGFTREVEFVLPETMPEGNYSLVALLDYGKTTTIKGTRLNETLIILHKKSEK